MRRPEYFHNYKVGMGREHAEAKTYWFTLIEEGRQAIEQARRAEQERVRQTLEAREWGDKQTSTRVHATS